MTEKKVYTSCNCKQNICNSKKIRWGEIWSKHISSHNEESKKWKEEGKWEWKREREGGKGERERESESLAECPQCSAQSILKICAKKVAD